ncbi:class I SAM-dependent methyltransferase [Pelosinus sp. UFO1]|uniref:class I SAM-dependent methyltransferase n=1 Tax=Pelosinus sp. UFO1 TaxID=484770 RepID=UPI0004D19B8A|nr:class I SAM-dependent methyltransferase [Pelosinus sp. UFO1]AIF54120.1 Methyltransferase type 11 [Pelosinus sp. UFO1]
MTDPRIYWNKQYIASDNKRVTYDLWLDKYKHILNASKDTPIIDLGCGLGNDTMYLYERHYEIISCDYSEEALKKLELFIDDPVTKLFDMKDGLPFESESVKVIIADLSLHYFSWAETREIVNEIKRVLKEDGFLLLRVNSVKDTNYGAGKGITIEKNYYNIDGNLKRFFDKEQLEKLFVEWDVEYIKEYEMNRYTNSKMLWEMAVKKVND